MSETDIRIKCFQQQCYETIKKFVRRVEEGTNIHTEKEIKSFVLSEQRKEQTQERLSMIEDQAKNDSDDSSSTASDSNCTDDDNDLEERCKEMYEDSNALECLIHPHNKRIKGSKIDSKISFAGLTVHDEEKHTCAQAALFLYWPKGISSFFLKNRLLFNFLASNVFSFFCICC